MESGRPGSYGPDGPSLRLTVLPFLTRFGRVARHAPVRRRLLVLLITFSAVAAPPQATGAEPTPLTRKLGNALRVAHVAPSRTGALAVDMVTGRTVYAHNLTRPLIPASNEKLAVAYAALVAFGPAHQFETEVVGEGEQEGTLWRGDVILKGYGDPTLSTLRLHALAGQVRAAGITRVTGRLVGDESYFDSRRTAPGWKSWFFINESPPLSALTVDRGRYRGRTSRNPPRLSANRSARPGSRSRDGRSWAGRPTTRFRSRRARPSRSSTFCGS
jgi:D-alanyl-D-alanine carboxypeptidase